MKLLLSILFAQLCFANFNYFNADYYEILELPRNTPLTKEQVEQAVKAANSKVQARTDLSKSEQTIAFRKIDQAATTLINEEEKKQYDAKLEASTNAMVEDLSDDQPQESFKGKKKIKLKGEEAELLEQIRNFEENEYRPHLSTALINSVLKKDRSVRFWLEVIRLLKNTNTQGATEMATKLLGYWQDLPPQFEKALLSRLTNKQYNQNLVLKALTKHKVSNPSLVLDALSKLDTPDAKEQEVLRSFIYHLKMEDIIDSKWEPVWAKLSELYSRPELSSSIRQPFKQPNVPLSVMRKVVASTPFGMLLSPEVDAAYRTFYYDMVWDWLKMYPELAETLKARYDNSSVFEFMKGLISHGKKRMSEENESLWGKENRIVIEALKKEFPVDSPVGLLLQDKEAEAIAAFAKICRKK